MVYNGIDISSWDSRVRKLVAKHGFEKGRIEKWIEEYNGNMKAVELEYLRHYGL